MSTPWKRDRGSVVLMALIMSIAFLVMMAAVVNTTLSMSKSVQYELDYTSALAIAEGVTESAQKRILDQVSNFQEPELVGTIAIGGVDYPYQAAPIGADYGTTSPDGVVSNVQHYVVTASIESGEGVAIVDRVIDLNTTPLFQFMIFFDDDLELLPGPSMNLGGRIHANGDIYVGAGSTLTVDTDYFRSTGSIYKKRKNDGSESGGTVNIKVTGETTYRELTNAEDAEYSDWTNYALDRWEGTVQDGSHGVKEVAAPDIGTIKAYNPDGTKGYYHENAGLVIVDGVGFDSSGNSVDISAAVTEVTMFDAREGKNVTQTQIDVAKLGQSGNYPTNGLIYAYRTDATPDQPNGIRLINGSDLPGNMTVVSEDPVYVQGDFNTADKKSASVIADAVNLLSNSWSDGGGAMQGAAETTYNMAFVTGNVPTPDGGGTYSGGFENLPRFHENWSGVSAHINGSFINMFRSELAKAPWGSSNVYRPPLRDWQFDQDLLLNLPPFTPSAVYFQRVLWDDRKPLPFLP